MIQATKKPATGKETIPAALYIRMSSDMQEDSPEQQRVALEQLGKRLGLRYVRQYGDEGVSGIERTKRASFEQMLRDAQKGEFKVIACWDQDRFSRLDSIDSGEVIAPLRRAGVRLITCAQGEIDWTTFGGRLIFNVQQEGKNQYLHDLSRNCCRGRVAAAKAGLKMGAAPFGYDRLIMDEAGHEVRRVKFNEKFRKPKGWTYKLVPSADTQSVEIVKWLYRSIAYEGHNILSLTCELIARQVPPPRAAARNWHWTTVHRILSNEVYVGTCVNGERSRGKFGNMGGRIAVEKAHEAIVDRKTFDIVQKSIAQARSRRNRRTEYVLTGITYCGHCGERAVGHEARGSKSYGCTFLPHREPRECPRPRFSADGLEKFVIDTVLDRALSRDSLRLIKQHVERQLKQRKSAGDSSAINRRVRQLEADLEKGKENLARASADDFAAISAVMQGWREELRQSHSALDRMASESTGRIAIDRVMVGLRRLRDDVRSADAAKVRAAIAQMVERVTIRRAQKHTRLAAGELVFKANLCLPPVQFTQADFHATTSDEAAVIVRKLYKGEPVTNAEFIEVTGMKKSMVCWRLKKAAERGLIEQVTRGRYVPV